MALVVRRYGGGGTYVYGTWSTSCSVHGKVCPSHRSHATHHTTRPDSRAHMLCQAVGAHHSSCPRCWRCHFQHRQALGGPEALLLYTAIRVVPEELKGSRADAVDGCRSCCPAGAPTPVTPWTSTRVAVAWAISRFFVERHFILIVIF